MCICCEYLIVIKFKDFKDLFSFKTGVIPKQPNTQVIPKKKLFTAFKKICHIPMEMLQESINGKTSYEKYTRKVKVLSLPETIQEKIDVSSEGPSLGVSSGGQGKTTRVFIRVDTKTSRDKIKANQMDFIKTK